MKPRRLLAVSDSTGETAERVTRSAWMQFQGVEAAIQRVAGIEKPSDIERVAARAAREQAVVLYTFADPVRRERMAAALDAVGVAGIDLIGPVLDRLANVFGQSPETVSGAQYRVDQRYRDRVEAIEYAVKHDDGMGRNTLDRADLILVGPSRTGKTPLSIYLANEGYRVANVPFIDDQPAPRPLPEDLGGLVIGLTVDPKLLRDVRLEQLERLDTRQGRSRYAEIETTVAEVEAACAYYAQHDWEIVDVSNRALEEIAVEVMSLLDRGRVRIRE